MKFVLLENIRYVNEKKMKIIDFPISAVIKTILEPMIIKFAITLICPFSILQIISFHACLFVFQISFISISPSFFFFYLKWFIFATCYPSSWRKVMNWKDSSPPPPFTPTSSFPPFSPFSFSIFSSYLCSFAFLIPIPLPALLSPSLLSLLLVFTYLAPSPSPSPLLHPFPLRHRSHHPYSR